MLIRRHGAGAPFLIIDIQRMTDPADPLRLNVDIAQDFFFLFAIVDVAGRNDRFVQLLRRPDYPHQHLLQPVSIRQGVGFDQRPVILQWLNFDVIVKSDRRFKILLVAVSRQLEHLAVVAGRADQQILAQLLDASPQNPRFSQKFFAAAFGIGFAEDRQIIGIGQRNQLEQVLQTGLVLAITLT